MEVVHYKLLGLTAFFLCLRVLVTYFDVLPAKARRVVGEYLDLGAIASIAALLLIAFVFQVSRVEGDSMFPTLKDGQYTLVNKLVYRLHPPERGDVIVFRSPQEPDRDYIKRVVALPGETIEIRNGWVIINGLKLKEPYVNNRPDYSRPAEKILPKHLFVLGDNRQNSSDSHLWGQLPFNLVRGKSSFILWPPSDMGLVRSYSRGNRWES
ncbi:MAG: signal peptidase I [Armatimonadota bacterium]